MISVIEKPVADWSSLDLGGAAAGMWWLGQAGFLIKTRHHALVIDAYLSDSLAEKYRGKRFAHLRMMPVPIEPTDLRGIDWVFSTHRHTDHMDAGTLPALFAGNPGCRYFCPKAAAEHAQGYVGIDGAVMTVLDAGDHIQLTDGIGVDVIASAHESLEYDAAGNSLFLGYIFNIDGKRIYHAGDCVPYDGLAESLTGVGIDMAMLPVNGRDECRLSNGIAGNFTFEEAVELCEQAGIGSMVAHHFGMFGFNTVDPAELHAKIRRISSGLEVIVPEVGKAVLLH